MLLSILTNYRTCIGVIKELLNRHKVQKNDIVIVNLGAWYICGENGQEKKYENAVSSVMHELKERSPSVKVLWMESTPQHFPGSDNGYFELNKAEKNMYEINDSMYDINVSNGCQPLGNYSLAHSKDYRNRLVERLRIGLPVIPMWNYLWNLSFAHVEQPKRVDGHNYGKKGSL